MLLIATISDSLRGWHDFFLFTGEASATLLGLVFVSTALVVGLPEIPKGRDVFVSPVIWEFLYAIVLSGACLVPWQSTTAFGVSVTLIGLAGFGQSLSLIRGLREFKSITQRASTERASFGVWIQVILLPAIAGAISAGSGILLLRGELRGLAGLAGAVSALAVVALTNAWVLFFWMLEQHHRAR